MKSSWMLCVLAALAMTATVQAAIPNDLQLVPVATGFNNPLAVRNAGDSRLFVVEKRGIIRIIENGAVLNTPFLNFNVASGGAAPPQGFTFAGEQGLLGLAFHPNYATNGRFFIYYTDGNGNSIVARYNVSPGNPDVANQTTETLILRVKQDATNHNGGDIHFGPDDMLYIALGDGGNSDGICNRSQTLNPALLLNGNVPGGYCDTSMDPGVNFDSRALLGKILRIDVDGTTAAGSNGLCGNPAPGSAANYSIPAGNPFADGATANGCDEVWHYGLRNPFRFSFDRQNGDLFIGDVGQSYFEEVDLFASGDTPGVNFGWNLCEGMVIFENGPPCNVAGTTLPIFSYGHGDGGCSVIGGFRYRGAALPQMKGEYFYGDFCTGEVWIANNAGGTWQTVNWNGDGLGFALSSFGEDQNGELYAVDYSGGRVLRFTAGSASLDIFKNGFEGN